MAGTTTEEEDKDTTRIKNMVYTRNKNDNQPGFEQPIKEADIGNKEDNHRNAKGRHCYNRNSNDWNDNVRC